MSLSASLSHQFNSRVMAGRGGKAPVTCQQRRLKRFREGDIDSIVGRQIMAQVPDARQKKAVRIPAQRKVAQIGERRAATLRINVAGRFIPAHDLRHFDIEQMRRVQRLPRIE